MFAIVFSLLAAVSYGVGDFFGAIASRKMHTVTVSFLGHIASSLVAGLGVLFVGGIWSGDGVFAGSTAGALEAVAFLVFYMAMARGKVAIIAPLVSVIYAIVPVVWAVFAGEALRSTGWFGILLGFLAIAFLAGGSENNDSAKPLGIIVILQATFAGVLWGFSTVALDFAPTDSGATPALAAGLTSFVILSLVMAFTPRSVRGNLKRDELLPSLLAGGLFGLANCLILEALATGQLALVGLLTALYPLSTVLLARFILKERLSIRQWSGIAMAIAAAMLISI